ncbi:hypothetical protein D3C71_1436880 [compost metagenome]
MGDRHAIAGAGQAQVLQADADIGGQAHGAVGVQTRCQQAEFASAIARRQPGATFRQLGQAPEQFAGGADQCVRSLAAQSLVEPVQVVDPQHQQMAIAALFAHSQVVGQLFVEQAPVGQAGKAVQIGFGPQFFAARSFFDK